MLISAVRADRIGGLIWIVFGAAILVGSWTMDRLEHLGIPPATAPGVPTGLLGASFIVFGLVLLLRRAPSVAPEPRGASTDMNIEPTLHWQRSLVSAGLCFLYAGGLLGRGLPYQALTFSFLFLHLLLLDETDNVPAKPTIRRTVVAASVAAGVTITVSLVFEKLFLVRLP
jgi:hypothetical protein